MSGADALPAVGWWANLAIRADGRRVGQQICKELIDRMVADADGFYIVPPQVRPEMAVELVDHIHQRVPARERG